MDKIIIGSTAIKKVYPDFKREPKDIDYAVRQKTMGYVNNDGDILDFMCIPVLFNYVNSEYIDMDSLLTLKISHLAYDIKWDKHFFDTLFLISKGHKLNRPLYDELCEYWPKFHTHPKYRRSDLNMSKTDFFTNEINYDDNEHDFIHTIITDNGNEPMYKKILVDGEEVMISEDKFNALSLEEKRSVVREEVYVMAYERFRNYHYRIAYDKMLKKFICRHAPVWMIPFIIFDFDTLKQPTKNFIDEIKNGIFAI